MVTSFFSDALGEHAYVTNDRNPFLRESPDFPSLSHSALELDCLGPGFNEDPGAFNSHLLIIIGVNREVSNEKCMMATSRRGGDMMGHVLKGYMCGVGKAEHDHAEGISHEDKVHSRLIEQAGGGIVPGCQGGNGRTFRLSCP